MVSDDFICPQTLGEEHAHGKPFKASSRIMERMKALIQSLKSVQRQAFGEESQQLVLALFQLPHGYAAKAIGEGPFIKQHER